MNKNYYEIIPAERVLSVSGSDLEAAFKEVVADWNKYLRDAGIKLPAKGTSKWYQLAILKRYERKAVHKRDISRLIAEKTETAATDQQVRHLKTQGGWFVLNRGDSHEGKYAPEGCHVLVTTKSPSPESTLGRRAAVAGGDWDEILEKYDNRCASCGTRIGERHRFDGSYTVEVLEKGHMDPGKPLKAGNIIPQCRWCNRTARGDFTFDEQGRPRAIASLRPVKRAGKDVIQKVRQWVLSGKR